MIADNKIFVNKPYEDWDSITFSKWPSTAPTDWSEQQARERRIRQRQREMEEVVYYCIQKEERKKTKEARKELWVKSSGLNYGFQRRPKAFVELRGWPRIPKVRLTPTRPERRRAPSTRPSSWKTWKRRLERGTLYKEKKRC